MTVMQLKSTFLSPRFGILLSAQFLCCTGSVLAESDNGTPNVFRVERAQSDSASTSITKSLKGNLEKNELRGEAAGAMGGVSKVPLQGAVSKSALPQDWNGNWAGNVRLDYLSGGVSRDVLQGSDVEMQLKLETAKAGSPIFNLKVRQLAGEVSGQKLVTGTSRKVENEHEGGGAGGGSPGTPDIHYWHEGNHNHLDITDGASMNVDGRMVIGGAPGEVSSMTISNHAHVRVMQDGSGRGTAIGDDYGSGGIYTNGATTYNGKYFKSDEKLASNQSQINANRIDIGNSTVFTNGSGVNASGNSQTGMLLSKLSGGHVYFSPDQISGAVPAPPVQLLNSASQLQIVHSTPNVYDITSATRMTGPSGFAGTQRATIRLTASASDKITIQMRIDNYDIHAKPTDSLTTSGYLRKQ